MKNFIQFTYCLAALSLLPGCVESASEEESAAPEPTPPAATAADEATPTPSAAEPEPAESKEPEPAEAAAPTRPKSWRGEQGCWSVDDQVFKSAPHSVRLVPKEGGFSYIASQRVEIKPDTEYLVSAYVRTEGNDEVNDFLPIRWFKGEEFIEQFGPVAPGDNPEWSLIEATAVAPSDATHADVAFFMQSQSGTIWIDDVSLKAAGDDTELLVNRSFDNPSDSQ